MIDAAGAEAEHLCREQGDEADGAGGGDDDLGEFLALDVIDDLEDGREGELLEFVLGQLEFADGLEILDRDGPRGDLEAGGDDDDLLAGGDARGGHLADGIGDAVDVLEGIGEPGAFAVLKRRREMAGDGERGCCLSQRRSGVWLWKA